MGSCGSPGAWAPGRADGLGHPRLFDIGRAEARLRKTGGGVGTIKALNAPGRGALAVKPIDVGLRLISLNYGENIFGR